VIEPTRCDRPRRRRALAEPSWRNRLLTMSVFLNISSRANKEVLPLSIIRRRAWEVQPAQSSAEGCGNPQLAAPHDGRRFRNPLFRPAPLLIHSPHSPFAHTSSRLINGSTNLEGIDVQRNSGVDLDAEQHVKLEEG